MWWMSLRCNPYKRSYFWVGVTLVRETRRAILVRFDGRWVWVPKVWILRRRRTGGGEMRIKVSEYDWAKKFG